jgi:hypothetical protein
MGLVGVLLPDDVMKSLSTSVGQVAGIIATGLAVSGGGAAG